MSLSPRADVAPRVGRTALRAIGAVVLFWWGATGALIALQRSAGTRLGALALALLTIPAGLWLIARARDRWDERAVIASFFGGALLWTSVSAAFYGGWIVGMAPRTGPGDPLASRVLDAITATGYSAVHAAALLAAALVVTRGATNRLGAQTFAIFWAAHELAKLNVFAGVVSPGAPFLPDYLAHLQGYFGPARNSALLPVSVAALALATAALVRRGMREPVPGRRVAAALLACIVALAAFELVVLGTPRTLGWWDAFLAWRGAA